MEAAKDMSSNESTKQSGTLSRGQRSSQRDAIMVVLVGLPGAGKTTFSAKLQQHGMVWVSQDAQGDRQASEILCENALAAGQHVVVDRCNVNRVQRRVWIQIARIVRHRVKKIAVQLVVPFEECKRRVQTRSRHPISPPHKAQEVVERFAKDLHPVFPDEGFDEVQIAYNDSDLETIAARIASYVNASGVPLITPSSVVTQVPRTPNRNPATPRSATSANTTPQRTPSPPCRTAITGASPGKPPRQPACQPDCLPHLSAASYAGSQPSSRNSSPTKTVRAKPPHPPHPHASKDGMPPIHPPPGALPRHPPYPNMPMPAEYYYPYGMDYMHWHGAQVPMNPYEQSIGWRPPYGHQMYWPAGMYPTPMGYAHPHQVYMQQPQWHMPPQGGPHGPAAGGRPLPDPYTGHSENRAGPPTHSPMHSRPPAARPPMPGSHMMYKHVQPAPMPMLPLSRAPVEGQIRAYMPHGIHPAATASPRTSRDGSVVSTGESGGKSARKEGREKAGKDSGAIALLKAKYADATGKQLDSEEDNRIILLFDLNGTLTSHSSKRKSNVRNRLRPGVEHLLRLKEQFRVGVYTSASLRTVEAVHNLLEEAVEQKIIDPALVLYRDHAQPQPSPPVKTEGGPVEAVKPLAKWFGKLDRVVLFDDDPMVVSMGEEQNVVMIPAWREEDEQDQVLKTLVDSILEVFGPLATEGDIRDNTHTIAEHLAAIPSVPLPPQMPEPSTSPAPGAAPSPTPSPPPVSTGRSSSSPVPDDSKAASPPQGLIPAARGPCLAFAPSTPTAAVPAKIAPGQLILHEKADVPGTEKPGIPKPEPPKSALANSMPLTAALPPKAGSPTLESGLPASPVPAADVVASVTVGA